MSNSPSSPISPLSALVDAVAEVHETVRRLRAPGGCPWDRAQTHQSLRPFLIEEAYEVLDVLDQIHDDTEDLKKPVIKNSFQEELGDLLMQVLLHSSMAEEKGAFNFADVARGLNEKLIRRHPHVFGEEAARDVSEALANWEKKKAEEKKKQGLDSVLDGLPQGLPALQKTARIIEKVTKVGFQWPDLEGPIAKVDEEWKELRTEITALQTAEKSGTASEMNLTEIREKVASEIGDLLFTVANVAYLLKIQPEDALRGTLGRFNRRFRHVEKALGKKGKKPGESSLEEMDLHWDEAKKLERAGRLSPMGDAL